ncbi:MAG: hypothetical protein ACFCU1_08125 [Sumerlaeia bacterium]
MPIAALYLFSCAKLNSISPFSVNSPRTNMEPPVLLWQGSLQNPQLNSPANNTQQFVELGSLSKLITQRFIQNYFTKEELSTPISPHLLTSYFQHADSPQRSFEWNPTPIQFLFHRSGLGTTQGQKTIVLLPNNCFTLYNNQNYQFMADWFESQTGKSFEAERLAYIKKTISAEGIQPASDSLPLGAGGLAANAEGLKQLYLFLANQSVADSLYWQATSKKSNPPASAYLHAGQTNRFQTHLFLDFSHKQGFVIARRWGQTGAPEPQTQGFSIPIRIDEEEFIKEYPGFYQLQPTQSSQDIRIDPAGTWESSTQPENRMHISQNQFNSKQSKNLPAYRLQTPELEGFLIETDFNTFALAPDAQAKGAELRAYAKANGVFQLFTCGQNEWLVWEMGGKTWKKPIATQAASAPSMRNVQ